jgi:hypothetical protein
MAEQNKRTAAQMRARELEHKDWYFRRAQYAVGELCSRKKFSLLEELLNR